MRAVIYARYSSHNQREESIEGQLRECTRYADYSGYKIVGEYIDRAISGRTDDRDSFQRMIHDSERHQFDVVICYAIDRFARNRYDSAMYKARLKRNGVRVVYAKQPIPEGPEGIILEAVMEGYAEYYSANLAQNIRRGMNENALQCKSTGGTIPFGYRVGVDHRLEVDPIKAPIVREIFSRYASGEKIVDICNTLNGRGIKTSANKEFGKSSLRTILTNQKYKGIYKYMDVVVEGGIPSIVEPELFDRVQEAIAAAPANRGRKRAKVQYLLSGKIVCGKCEHNMVGESGKAKSGKIYNYYKCHGRKKDPQSCDKKAVPKDWIEELAVDMALQQLTDERIAEYAQAAVERLNDEESNSALINALKAEISDTTVRLGRLVRFIQDVEVPPQTILENIDELEKKLAYLKQELDTETRMIPRFTPESIEGFLYELKESARDDEKWRQSLIEVFIHKIFVYDLPEDPDGRPRHRFVFIFNTSPHDNVVVECSDVASYAPPQQYYPNPFMLKRGRFFGVVLDREVAI